MRIILLSIFIFASISFSNIETQTDWSGSGGVPGPVADWSNCYDVTDQIDDSGGSLALDYRNPVENLVDENYSCASSVHAADVDGDRDTDVLGASSNNHEISWWNVKGYPALGFLESSILDAGAVESWVLLALNKEEPDGTSVGFEFRSSDHSTDMGEWSEIIYASSIDLSSLLADFTDFVQYRVILQTTCLTSTPSISDVTIGYSISVSIGDINHTEVPSWNHEPAANSSFGSFSVQVSVPESALVDLLLYDVTGLIITQR